MSAPGGLRLRARDADDLAVISACLQDAVVPVSDIAYLPDEKRFAMVANRFRWEKADDGAVEGRIYERVHAGICFDEVRAVRYKSLDRSRPGQMLSLLSVAADDGRVELTFSAGTVIRLEVERLVCHLQDLDEPWPTQWRPTHRIGDED